MNLDGWSKMSSFQEVGQREEDLVSKTLYQEYYALLHLEGIEEISQQCEHRTQLMKSNLTFRHCRQFKEIAMVCVMPSEEDKANLIGCDPDSFVKEVEDVMSYYSMESNLNMQCCFKYSLKEVVFDDMKTGCFIKQVAIFDLTHSTSYFLAFYHELAKCFINMPERSPTCEVAGLFRLTTTFCAWLDKLYDHYSSLLNIKSMATPDSTLISDPQSSISIESLSEKVASCTRYVENAVDLFVPIVNFGAIQEIA